jgi:hypothetical protein
LAYKTGQTTTISLHMYRHRPNAGRSYSITGLLFGLILAAAPLSAVADNRHDDASRVSLHGFGTLGMVRGDNDNGEFIRDLTQPAGAGTSWTARIDSLVGIQANIALNPQTQGVLQAVSRYHSDGSHDPELTWAFLRHDVSPDFTLRVGRLGTEFYMLGDSRLVGYSNVSVRPPPDFYGSLVFSYIDGLDLSGTWPLAEGLLNGKLFAGRSPERTPFSSGLEWDQRGTLLAGGYLDFRRNDWQIRISHAGVRFNHETPTDLLLQQTGDPLSGLPYLSLVPEMAMQDRWAHFSSIGLVYDRGPLNLQLMFNRIEQDSPAYADSRAGYLLASYSLGKITPYLGFSRSLAARDPLPTSPIPGIDEITLSLVSQSHMDQFTTTLGGRWDLTRNLALKAQLDWIRGDADSLFLFKNTRPGWDGEMTVYSLALDFVF